MPYQQLGSLPFGNEFSIESSIGRWAIESDPGSKPKMYVDEVMRRLIGVDETTSPEDTYRAFYAGIDRDYLDSVQEAVRRVINGIRAEVQYPWHYPDGRTLIIRCESNRNFSYEKGIRIEGWHRDITNLIHLQKESTVISALSRDFDWVSYIKLQKNKKDDYHISFRESERIRGIIPEWSNDNLSVSDRFDLMSKLVSDENKRQDLIDKTRREKIIENLEKNEFYYVNIPALIHCRTEYLQLKFVADRDEKNHLIGFVFGVRSIDGDIRQQLILKEKTTRLVEQKTKELKEKNDSLSKVNNRIIDMIGNIVESRDEESGNHSSRVRLLAHTLALQVMRDLPEYGLTVEDVTAISDLAPLHDIGKIRIPDSILFKDGKLTKEEFEIMKTHCEKGCGILEEMADGWNPKYVKMSMDICRYHHEKWDGSGYPSKLCGDDIPIAAQIVSLADIYDALVSERRYKPAFSHKVACRMIENGECGKFSEKILSCFNKCKNTFATCANSDPKKKTAETEALLSVSRGEYISKAVPLLEKISACMPGGFFICEADEDDNLIYFNDMMVEYLGCSSREEFIKFTNNSFRGIVHPDDFDEACFEITSQVDKNNVGHVVFRAARKDGTVHWLDTYGKFIRSEDMGDVFFVFVVDCTESVIRRNPQAAQSADRSPATGALNDLKILVVDDSAMFREMHSEFLEKEGASVTAVENGFEAISRVKESTDYDLILMNLVMPMMSGVTAVREIKKLLDGVGKRIPIICLTSAGSDMQVKEALQAGAFDCLYKPLTTSKLSAAVVSAIRNNSMMMEQELKSTKENATTDALTKAKNTTAFMDKTEKLTADAKENPDLRFAMLLCDCDKLKFINDTYGHIIGDKFICNTADKLAKTFRNSPVYRIGGDEFVVVAEGKDLKKLDALAIRLESMNNGVHSLGDISAGKANFSFGICVYGPETDISVKDVLKCADAEMYKMKKRKTQNSV